MARTKRRIRDRGRKSQKRKKPIRTRRRRRGSVKRRRTKSRQVLKGGSCLGCGSRPHNRPCQICGKVFNDKPKPVRGGRGYQSELDRHICNVHCPDYGYTCTRAYNCQ